MICSWGTNPRNLTPSKGKAAFRAEPPTTNGQSLSTIYVIGGGQLWAGVWFLDSHVCLDLLKGRPPKINQNHSFLAEFSENHQTKIPKISWSKAAPQRPPGAPSLPASEMAAAGPGAPRAPPLGAGRAAICACAKGRLPQSHMAMVDDPESWGQMLVKVGMELKQMWFFWNNILGYIYII